MRGRSRDLVYRVIVAIGSLLLRLLDVRREVRGAENVPASGGGVLAISHFSYLDFVLCEWAIFRHHRRYTRFMATAASFRHPVSGPVMRAMHHIPVDRSKGASAYRHAVEALRAGELVGVFPETRVSRSFTLLPFKNGAARMAAQSGLPLIPCVIWGSHRVSTRTHQSTLRDRRHRPVMIIFGAPIPVAAGADPTAVTEQLRRSMEALLARAQDDYPEHAEPGAWWQPAHRAGGAPTPQAGIEIDERQGAQ